jgi:hypothetical protein
MRVAWRETATAIVVLAASLALMTGCSKSPPSNAGSSASASSVAAAQSTAAASAGSGVSGTFSGDGKQVTLTQVTALKDDPFDGQPVTALVFSSKDQGGDPKAATNALFGNFGDALVAKVTPDGSVVETDVIHSGLQQQGSVSVSGVLKIKNFVDSGGVISGEITSSGPSDVFGKKLDVDLTFHTKAP